MEEIIVASFYKYIEIESPERFAKEHLEFCKELGIRGRILVAREGINGSVSGTKEQIERYKKSLRSDKRFSDITFKEDTGLMHPFNKMKVKVKKEIVRFEYDVDLRKAGKHISVQEFLELYKKGEAGKEVLILDARNNYESRVGKFKGAITPNISTFREFVKVSKMLADKKDKKIVMYCTGGIRCEKASAYLVQEGFKDVYQLDGGILSFGKKFPDSVWEGKCFVFDKRLLSAINSEEKPLTVCEFCSIPCDLYKNCAKNTCDKYCIVCLDCEKKFGGCCSKECFQEIQAEAQTKLNIINSTFMKDKLLLV